MTNEFSARFEQIGERPIGPLVAVAFGGTYPPGSDGNEFALEMVAFVRAVVAKTNPNAVLFDLRGLNYTWGDGICSIVTPLLKAKRFTPSAIVASGDTARALRPFAQPRSLLGVAGAMIFETREEAVAHLNGVLDKAPVEAVAAPADRGGWRRILKEARRALRERIARLTGWTSTLRRGPTGLKAYWAYAFTCDLPMDAMASAWNAAGPWRWEVRDSHWYGDYLNTRPMDGVRVRIHESADRSRYTCLLQIDRDSSATRAQIDNVLRSLLERIDVRTTTPIEPYD